MRRIVYVTWRPISAWNSPRVSPKASVFRKRDGAKHDALVDELARLGVRNVVIEGDYTESQITNSGMPYARATPSSPRIRVAFKHPKQGPLIYEAGQYTNASCNIYAVAKTLEALRAVDRYGVSGAGEQYAGWKALPASGMTHTGIVAGPFVDAQGAAQWIADREGIAEITPIRCSSPTRTARWRSGSTRTWAAMPRRSSCCRTPSG